ncbi:MAG: hypothetical protein A3G17_00690 [Planctomycetes bacterium RIFCSPLOWO2_12_FULL_50_35]|nr:MAG: hypothetical protein A3G17_00690 [Planctomycetes bacterium RIFCSPLOWO2_12_FULL_50_35]HLA28081.1 hypothetical protein [Syntrophales bacterium]
MVAIGISEFSFGFAFLEEQITRCRDRLRCAPILPSLREEAVKGFDAHLPTRGIDFYYQFKISDYLWYWNATYISNGTYPGPYYRFWVDSNQHRRLFRLSQHKHYTYYVAPRMRNREEFDNAFLTRTVTPRSVLVPVRDCGNIIKDTGHCITLPENSRGWEFHSESNHFESEINGEKLEIFIKESKQHWQPIDDKFAHELVGELWGLAEKTFEWKGLQYKKELEAFYHQYQKIMRRDYTDKLLMAAMISSFFFGANLILVGEKE